MSMTMEQMAAFLRRYEQQVRTVTNIHRYASLAGSIDACPGVFGLDVDALIAAPDDQKLNVYMAQQDRAELLRRLMAGASVDGEAMRAAFGFTGEELEALRRAQDPVKKTIPRKLCVLCFDDAYKTQYTVAKPVLERLGFDATFFIAELQHTPQGFTFENKDVFMTWEEIKALQDAGFELANHSLHHINDSLTRGHDFNIAQIRGMEEEFARHGLDKPVTYGYPSGASNPEVVACARECGYKWARGNLEKGPGEGIRGMTYYDPHVDPPLAICNFGEPDFYSPELIQKRLEDAPEGTIFGITYHDVGDAHWPGPVSFTRQMEALAELGVKVISVRGLEEYIDPEKAWRYTAE